MRLGVKKKAGGSRFWVRKKGEGLWVRKKGLWVRKEELGVRKEGLGVRKEGLWVRKEGLWVRKEGLWVRKKGLWVRKKGCGSEKKGCGSEKKESPPDSLPSHHLACAILLAPIIPALPPAPPLLFILPLSCASLPVFICLFSSTVPLSSCISVLFLVLALFFPLFCFLCHLNLLYLLSFVFSLPLTGSPLITWHVPSYSGSNHPSSRTCPTPLIYPSPLLRVSSSFLCLVSSTVPLSSCISVLFLFLALFFPLFCFHSFSLPCSFLSSASSFIGTCYILFHFVFSLSPLTASPLITWHVPS